MRLTDLDHSDLRIRTSEEVFDALRAACEANPDVAAFEVVGRSEEGRPIAGVTLGYGPRLVTLCAGAHADEPVGPETLRLLVLVGLAARDWESDDGEQQDDEVRAWLPTASETPGREVRVPVRGQQEHLEEQ